MSKQFLLKWGGPLLITIVFFALTILTWRKWPNLLIDSGRELYIPWQLCEKHILYRDIAYCFGPLAPYLNAFIFNIFGTSLKTLIISNLILIAGLSFLIYFVFTKYFDHITAIISSIIFLTAFAFAQYKEIGCFNYVLPYDHNTTYGIFLSIISFVFISYNLYHPNKFLIIISGIFAGLTFLTKTEIVLPTISISIMAILISNHINKMSLKFKYFSFILLFISIIFSIILFNMLLYIAFKVPLDTIFVGLTANISAIINTKVSQLYFYESILGTDRWLCNLLLMFASLIAILSVIGPLILLLIENETNKYSKLFILQLLLIGFIVNGIIYYINISYAKNIFQFYTRSIPLFILLINGVLIYCVFTKKLNIPNILILLLWGIYSLMFLNKIILNTTLGRYGFIHSMPALLCIVIFVIWFIPKLLDYYGCGYSFKKYAVIISILFMIVCLFKSFINYNKKNYLISQRNDSFYTYNPEIDPSGPAVNQLLNIIKKTITPQQTLIVLPEGVMINYLTRRKTSIPYIVFLPPELAVFGEESVVEAMHNNPADYVILIQRSIEEYKVGIFGIDPNYGKLIMNFVNDNYTPVLQLLHDPSIYDMFGIKLLKRK